MSSSNSMLISYTNSYTSGYEGFVANYEGLCGGDLFVDSIGYFTTPNYPSLYPLNKKCRWRIVVPKEYQVVLSFQYFDVEQQSDCHYDYVEVRNSSNGLIGTYCNSRAPPRIVANSSSLLVYFVSDYSINKGGFNATVSLIIDECSRNNHGCAHQCENLPQGGYRCTCRPGYQLHSNGKSCEVACGGSVTAGNGLIRSPSYPSNYPPNTDCTWIINTTYENSIKIFFHNFYLENGTSTTCDRDWVKVSRKVQHNPLTVPSGYCPANTSTNVQTIDTFYCGSTLPAAIITNETQVTISFHSDSTVQKGGFVISHQTATQMCLINNANCFHGCTGSSVVSCTCNYPYTLQSNRRDCVKDCDFEISSTAGTFNSPNYPNMYPVNKVCTWRMRTTPGHRINITFVSFQLEHHVNCQYDSLSIYDGDFLGKFCGSVLPPQFNSSTNELNISFTSNSEGAMSGFQATYAPVCGGNVTADGTEKYIYSHADYGYINYNDNVFCEWNIQASAGKKVTVAFLSFELESGSCGYDYVEILDKRNGYLVSLGRYCWNNAPPRICSTNSTLVIRFKTDHSVNRSGFVLIYKATG